MLTALLITQCKSSSQNAAATSLVKSITWARALDLAPADKQHRQGDTYNLHIATNWLHNAATNWTICIPSIPKPEVMD